jgi:hypothetical protein
MQTSPTWLVPLVVALVVLGVALLVAALVRSARPPAELPVRSWDRFDDDDLPRFAALPPGSATAAAAPAAGDRGPGPRAGRGGTVALAAAGVAVLLTGAGITAVAASADPVRSPSVQPVSATLTFAGVVLEPRAVGVTVTYPEVSVRVAGNPTAALAHVRFPAFNCLTTGPPADPDAAGCVRALDEYADLAAPALTVARPPGGGLRFSGRFATYTRPNGTPPVPTGRVYELAVDVVPLAAPGAPAVPARGEAILAGGRTATVSGEGVNVLRYGD